MEKYDYIGERYNQTRKADPFLLSRLIHHLQPKQDGNYLDIGCGTGNYTIALHQNGLNIDGIEPSDLMRQEAQSRSNKIKWTKGIAELLPFDNNSYDGVLATLTIHHWENLNMAFAEIVRVLKPGSRVVIFTSTSEQMQGYWLNHFFPKMIEKSMLQMPSLTTIESALNAAGLTIQTKELYHVKDDLQDCFLYVGKNKPALYFNASIRNGISSFSALANQDEVAKGLIKLQQAIDDNTIQHIQEYYKNDLGDYMFIVAG
ncbi:MAG: class I SAM-dependent methyltransferase [Flavobacteriales bacterium]